MTSAAVPFTRKLYFAPLLLGAWAAAVAVAPTLALKLALAAPAVLLPLSVWTLELPPRWIACFFAAALLLPPLPIAWGDSGPHPSLWFAALGLVAGVFSLNRWNVPLSGLNAALLAFLTVLLFSIAPAALYSGPAVAGNSLVRVGLFAIGVYVFFFTAHGPGAGTDPWASLRRLFWVAVAAALFACIDFYFQFPAPAGYGAQFVWLDSGVYRRAQGLFYEASTLGNFCAFFLVMIAVAIARPRAETPVSRIALALGGAVSLAAMVLSYSRSSVLNVLTALAVLAWLNRKRIRLLRLVVVLIPGAAVAAWLIWNLLPQFVEMYWLRLSASAVYLTTATEGVLSGRLASWRILMAWIAAHPWQAWLGLGYKTLPYSDYLGAPVVGDNMYLTTMVETGVLGLAALVWLCVAILRASARAARAADPTRSFLGTWILCFWAGQMVQMFSGDLLTYWRVLPLYFWVLALAVRP
jgi:hypothetical protein